MAAEKTLQFPKSIWGKIARQIALRRTKSRKKKLAKRTLVHVRELPEHTKRDIGWINL